MSRFNAKALTGAALMMACCGTAFGQLVVQEPIIDNREFVGDTTRILFDIQGLGAENILGVTAQVFVVRDDGVATAVAGARALPPTAVYATGADFSVDGGFFGIVGANDDVIVDMGRALGSTPDLVADLAAAEASLGMMPFPNVTNVTIYIQYAVQTTGGTVTTVNPSAADPPEVASAANGGIEAGIGMVTSDAADVSPQYISAPTLSSVTISDPAMMPITNYIFNRVLNTGNAANNLNQLIVANVNEDDLEINGAAPTMAPGGVAFGPTNDVLRVTYPASSVVSAGDTVGFQSDIAGTDNLPDARDFVGYSLVNISATASNAIALAPIGATFTASSIVGGNTGVIQVCFNQALSNPGAADAYDIQLGDAQLRQDGNATLGVPAIDAEDPSKVNITIDFNAGGDDEVGIAANGRALDDDIFNDDDGTGVNDHGQLEFFVEVRDDGTDPVDALGNNLDLGGMEFVDNMGVGDEIEPSFQFATFHDTDGDGLVDAVALVFDETVANPSITGVTITALDGTNTTDISMRDPLTGELPAAAAIMLMGGNQTIPATFAAGLDTVDLVAGDDNPAFQTNNAVVFSGLDLMTFADNMAPVPSTGDDSNFRIDYDGTAGSIEDSNGNAFSPMATVMQVVDEDRAAPALLDVFYFTGDNQDNANNQFVTEQDGNVGDASDNDRAKFVFSEDLGDNVADETGFTVNGMTFDTFNDNDGRIAGGTMDNMFTLENEDDVEYGPGDTVALNGGVDISDATGNEAMGSQIAANCVAPYIPLQNDGGVIDSAFLLDTDNDGFADQIFLQFTEAVVQADLASDGSDFQSFGANSGTITGADTLTGADNSIVVLSLVDGEITMNAAADIRYLGSTAMNLLASSATGKEVTDVDTAFEAQEINEPFINTPSPDVMEMVGQLIGPDGVTGVPIGTRIYAAVAVPTVNRITATHNGVNFEYCTYSDNEDSDNAGDSLDAFTSVLLGFRSFLYLQRDLDNEQVFTNFKYNDEDDDNGSGILTDTIDVTLNTRNLERITFNGVGETNQDRTNGTVGLQWRLLRGESTPGNYYRDGYSGDSNTLLLSEAVVSEADGRYELKVSGLGSAFTGGPLAALDLPVIIWCQLPTGERYALSSLLTSASTNDFDADGVVGDGIIFSPNNLTQDDDGTASDAWNVNFNIGNVTMKQIFGNDWTMLPFSSNGGFANSSRDLPELPTGVNEVNITTGSMIAASPMEQFVFWDDNDFDGVWDSDDGGFGDILIDFDTTKHMRFSLTTNGIQMGTGMTQAIGGYGIGVLNIESDNFGVFQFGAPLAAGPVFPANPVSSSVARSTNGWLLVSTSAESMPATNFFTTNAGSDYIIFFDNQGNDGISVRSLSVTPGDANANDLEELPACSAPFVHWIN